MDCAFDDLTCTCSCATRGRAEASRLRFIIEGLRTANKQLARELQAKGGSVVEITGPNC